MTYSEALSQLQTLVEKLESGDIPLEELPAQVQLANELLECCEVALRGVQAQLPPEATGSAGD